MATTSTAGNTTDTLMTEPLEINFSEFDEYIRQGEPDQKERASNWSMAIGLQAVDGLHVSDFLIQTALRNIKGEITMDEAIALIDEHWAHKRAEKKQKTSVQNAETSEKTAKTSEKKQKTSVQIIKMLRDNPTYTAEKLGKILGKSTRAMEMQLSKLVSQNAILHIGPNKGGHWEVLKEEDAL